MEWLGVDVGWVYPAADSDGRIYRWKDEKAVRSQAQKLAQAGPVTIRRADGTVEVREPYDADGYAEIANRHQHIARCRGVAGSILSRCKATHRGLSIEDWSRDRRHRNFLSLYQELVLQARYRRIPLAMVARQYTSQTCPVCGHVDEANRPERNNFLCVRCSYTGQADVVAAQNIAARASRPGARYITKTPKLSKAERDALPKLLGEVA